MADDPYVVLGVDPGATEDELRVARRRLALELHPDRVGGTAAATAAATAAMQRLNLAFDTALARLGDAPSVPDADPATRTPPGSGAPGSPVSPGSPGSPRSSGPPGAPPDVRPPVPRSGGRLAHDVASFTIEALPAEAFEAVLIVAGWLGEVIDDEPPYRLDVWLGEPFGCWCRLDLVPDAGASTVALTLGSIDGGPVPDLDVVRDTWVAELNSLGHPDNGF